MPSHKLAEQNEIILINHLKALYNSIRSTTELTIAQTQFMESEEVQFVLERIKMFEKEMNKLKLNTLVKKTLIEGLSKFKKQLPETAVTQIIQMFRNEMIIPLEQQMVEQHKNPEEKNWIKSCFVILR